MKIVIINKSDSTGGAAIVSRRLMEALRSEGVDARMLVAERLSDSPYVSLIASPIRIKAAFLADRLRIAFANGFNRHTLFQLDAAAAGIDLATHPLVKDADAIIINWINQGVLSLKGIDRLAASGKKILWTMHDMWNFTGICHHAGECKRYQSGPCGNCPMLEKHSSAHDLSYLISRRKEGLYSKSKIGFIAVSNWLADRARKSFLLSRQDIFVIPNAFPMPPNLPDSKRIPDEELRLIFGSARIDDPIKDFPLLIASLDRLKELDPNLASRTSLTLFGGIKDPALLDKIPINYTHHGILHSQTDIARLYRESDIVISTSSYETLPGTQIEGQAGGCWPIALDSGGQRDIIDDGITGCLLRMPTEKRISTDAEYYRNVAADMFAKAIIESYNLLKSDTAIPARLRQSVADKFSAPAVAREYLRILNLESRKGNNE